jgi:hypothetical protein
MALTYTPGTPLADLDPVDLALRLSETVAAATPWLEQLSGAQAAEAPAAGKWSPKEVMGHLIDSAVNNLQRIVRLETVLDIEPDVRTQTYEQDEWVRAQHYIDRDWAEILEFWRALNTHIAWTMRHIAREHLTRLCVFPEGHVTMGFLMEDYIAHMEHHLQALKH